MLDKINKAVANRISFTMLFLLIACISLFMHRKVFEKDLISFHVWRQTQTQSTIINFYEEDFNILNPRRNNRGDGDGIFRMEFPIMQWLFASVYKIFGNHLIISRVLTFILGLISIFGLYRILLNLFQKKVLAFIGAWAFNFSPSFYYYTLNPLPDNFALCCAIWGMAYFLLWYRNQRFFHAILCGLFLSLAALSKLPFVIYFILPGIYFVWQIIRHKFSKHDLFSLLLLSAFLVPPAVWYVAVIPGWHGNGIVGGITNLNVPLSTIYDYLQHNLIVNLPESLLNYGSLPFFLVSFYFILKRKVWKNDIFIMLVALSFGVLAYYFFEVNMIGKVHDYYLFPFYPILFILVGYGAYQLLSLNSEFWNYFTLFCLIILPLTCYLRMEHRWDTNDPGFNKDLLLHKEELQNAVPKDALCIAGNDMSCYIFFYYIDKKGWCFNYDNLHSKKIEQMIKQGARYLYSDSRKVDENKELQSYIDYLVLERGSIRIYSLKLNANSENTPLQQFE